MRDESLPSETRREGLLALSIVPECPPESDSEAGLLFGGHIQYAVGFCHQRPKLLLAVGHARREGCDVPVDVGISLLAAKAEDVYPLRRNRDGQGASEPVNELLKREILSEREVVRDSLAMFDRRRQHVTAKDVPVR